MSTKIWTAFRIVKGNDPWDVCMTIKRRGRAEAKQRLIDVYQSIKCHVEGSKSWWAVRKYVYDEYKKSVVGHTHLGGNLDTTVSVRKLNRSYYLIPNDYSFLLSGTLDFMQQMNELEDYHYQNQCDRSVKDYNGNEITASQWGARKRTWDKLCDDWSSFMTIDIVSIDSFPYVDPAVDMIREGVKF